MTYDANTMLDLLLLLSPIFVSGILTWLLITLLVPLVFHLNILLDTPDLRKRHGNKVPLVGGVAIYSAVSVVTALYYSSIDLESVLVGAFVLVGVGVWDDAFGVGVKMRLTVQACATVMVMLLGSKLVNAVGIEFFDSLLEFEFVAVLFTMLGVLTLTNAFNFIDGIDGLAAGQALVSLSTVIIGILISGMLVPQIIWLIAVMFSLLGFLRFNLSSVPLKRVFLGDGGSLFLGFLIAWVLIFLSQPPISAIKPIFALWSITFPVIETCSLIFRRLASGSSPFVSDRRHLHYLLIDSGVSQRATLWLILFTSLLVNVSGVLLSLHSPTLVVPILFFGLLLVVLSIGSSLLERYILLKTGN